MLRQLALRTRQLGVTSCPTSFPGLRHTARCLSVCNTTRFNMSWPLRLTKMLRIAGFGQCAVWQMASRKPGRHHAGPFTLTAVWPGVLHCPFANSTGGQNTGWAPGAKAAAACIRITLDSARTDMTCRRRRSAKSVDVPPEQTNGMDCEDTRAEAVLAKCKEASKPSRSNR